MTRRNPAKNFIGKPYAGKPHVRIDEGAGKEFFSFPLYSTGIRYYRKTYFALFILYKEFQKVLRQFFPTGWNNATKFGISHILIAITLSSICGISRIYKIATYSVDSLVKALLKLDEAMNETENSISKCEFLAENKKKEC